MQGPNPTQNLRLASAESYNVASFQGPANPHCLSNSGQMAKAHVDLPRGSFFLDKATGKPKKGEVQIVLDGG